MNNLFNLARNGLGVAQAALRVTGDNLNNGLSDAYSRRSLIIGELGGMSTQRGFFGYGAKVSGVERAYDAFATNQLRGSVSNWASLSGRMEQLTDIDNMLADESDNVSVSLNNLFTAMSTLSGNPSDGPARAAVYNSLGSLSQRYNESAKRLTGLEKSTNTQIEKSTKDINSYTEQLAEINKQLERAQGSSPPADLLDQRDALMEKISEQIGIDVTEDQVTGRVNIMLADGRPLVSGDTAYKLKTSPSDTDPNKTIVSYVDGNGKETSIDENSITKGRLAGLFKFRNEDLTVARNDLNQIAFMMAHRMNEQNQASLKPDGTQGDDLFSLPDMKGIANAKNAGTGKLDTITVTDYKQVNAEDYTVSFEGGVWTVTGSDGRTVPAPVVGGKLSFDGVEIDVSGGGFADGDSFSFNPMAGAAEGIGRAITSAQDFAAADASGGADNNNLEEMLKIQTEELIGKSTLTDAYSELVGKIGASARSVKSGIASAEIDLETKYNTKQALSGVDMNEEKINLDMFMQYYNANAQILQTATAMFDSLLAIR
jgi:flagellar hook-associated protein 1 FlgK